MKKTKVKDKPFRPKSFTVFNQKYKIKYVKNLFKTQNAYGLTHFDCHLILIQLPTNEFPMEESVVKNTLLHELGHVIFRSVGREDLNTSEQLVDQCALVMSQIMDTIK